MERRFQFGLKNLFWAMTWMAVWLAWWSLPSLRTTELPNFIVICLFMIYPFVFVGAPFAAIGALMGRMKRGILVGTIAAIALGIPVWLFSHEVIRERLGREQAKEGWDEVRIRMVDDLMYRHDFQGMTRQQIVDMLGEPDETDHFKE